MPAAQQALAVLVALALNAGLLPWLLRGPGVDTPPRRPALRLWLLPRPPLLPPLPPPARLPPAPSRPDPAGSRKSGRPLAVVEPAVVGAGPPAAATADDAWSLQRRDRQPDTVAGPGFRPDVFRRAEDDPLKQAARLPLAMRDSSLMGRWADMQHATLCGDLRAALRKPGNGASQDAILASMARYGCRP